jgi:glycosyltransferase 2 family protein
MPDPHQPERRAVWTWVLPTLLAGVLLYFSLRGIDWGQVWQYIAHAQWRWLAAAGLVMSTSSLLRSLRWRVILNAAASFDVLTVFWATMAGYLGNTFLPARAGELVRTFIISSRSSLTRTYVLTTALSERMMDAIALVLWSSVVLLGVHPKPAWLDHLSQTLAVGAAGGLLAVIILPHTNRLCEVVIRRLPLPESLRGKLVGLAEQMLLGLKAFHSVPRFLTFAAYTVVIWTLDACTVILGGRALGIELAFAVAALLICAMGLGSALPSTPGYVGIYQFVAVSVLVPFGVSKDGALALILVQQALGYVVVLAFGLPGLYRFKGWRTAIDPAPANRAQSA